MNKTGRSRGWSTNLQMLKYIFSRPVNIIELIKGISEPHVDVDSQLLFVFVVAELFEVSILIFAFESVAITVSTTTSDKVRCRHQNRELGNGKRENHDDKFSKMENLGTTRGRKRERVTRLHLPVCCQGWNYFSACMTVILILFFIVFVFLPDFRKFPSFWSNFPTIPVWFIIPRAMCWLFQSLLFDCSLPRFSQYLFSCILSNAPCFSLPDKHFRFEARIILHTDRWLMDWGGYSRSRFVVVSIFTPWLFYPVIGRVLQNGVSVKRWKASEWRWRFCCIQIGSSNVNSACFSCCHSSPSVTRAFSTSASYGRDF